MGTTEYGKRNYGFPAPESFTERIEMPDPYTFLDGRAVTTPEEFEHRLEELKRMYEYYMYGPLPDPSKETVSYEIAGEEMIVTVSAGERSVSYKVKLALPTKKVYEEAPVLFSVFGLMKADYANERGYGVLFVNPIELAADNATRTGVFTTYTRTGILGNSRQAHWQPGVGACQKLLMPCRTVRQRNWA